MKSEDYQSRIALLADALRREVNESIGQMTESVERVAPAGPSEARLDVEWWTRFWLETQLIPSALAIACGVFGSDPGNRDSLDEDSTVAARMRALIGRIQTRPLLEMDSEFERYMVERHKTLQSARAALLSGDLSREELASRTFDCKFSDIAEVDA